MDGCPLLDLVQSVSVTVAAADLQLADLKPGPTFVFQLHIPAHRKHLARWLDHAHTILGMNLQFDLLYLRSQPDFRFHLGQQILIDLSVLNYLHSELRPERSLKSLGPILGTHSYTTEQVDRTKKYHDSKDPALLRYNAADTHNTLLASAELARRIQSDYPNTDKLSPECLTHYSDTIWTVIRMSEAGVPMDYDGLVGEEQSLLSQMHDIVERSATVGLTLEGKGSTSSKLTLMQEACSLVELTHPDFRTVYRQAAKGANFGDLFRAGPATIQTQVFKMTGIVVPLVLCENIVKTRSHIRPGLWKWQENLVKDTHTLGYLALPFIGQSRRFMGGDAYDISEIVNMPVQCTAGNVLLRIQHRLHQTMPSINAAAPDMLMFLNVYDAIYFDVRTTEAIARLDTLFKDAFHYVTTEGYWARLCARLGRSVPIRYERTIYTPPCKQTTAK